MFRTLLFPVSGTNLISLIFKICKLTKFSRFIQTCYIYLLQVSARPDQKRPKQHEHGLNSQRSRKWWLLHWSLRLADMLLWTQTVCPHVVRVPVSTSGRLNWCLSFNRAWNSSWAKGKYNMLNTQYSEKISNVFRLLCSTFKENKAMIKCSVGFRTVSACPLAVYFLKQSFAVGFNLRLITPIYVDN